VALDRVGLAHAVNRLIVEHGFEHEDLAKQANMASSTLWEIRSGISDSEFKPSTLARLSLTFKLAENALNREYRKPVPHNSVLSDPSILVREVAAAIAPELAGIRERLDQIEMRLDSIHGPGNYLAAEVDEEIRPHEGPGGQPTG
jgi:predicted transcriptional regulator